MGNFWVFIGYITTPFVALIGYLITFAVIITLARLMISKR
jgi:hypothetical protein